jgi:hypothetical protein
MTTWTWIGIILVLVIIMIYKKARKDAYKEPLNGTTIIQPGCEDYEVNEHSPENLKFDRALKSARLRTKLQNIELERSLQEEGQSAPFIPMSVDDYLLLRRMKGYTE